MVTGQLPSPPLFFGCWRSLRSCARGDPSTRRARPGKSSEEISDEGAPEKTFRGAGPGGTEGLEGPERARTIRRTAAKKRRRHTGPGGPELCDGTPWTQQPAAPADAHQLVEAQRKPGRALRACPSLPRPGTTQRHWQFRRAAGGRRPAPGCGIGGPPPPTTSESRPRRRTARGDRPRKTGHQRGGLAGEQFGQFRRVGDQGRSTFL